MNPTQFSIFLFLTLVQFNSSHLTLLYQTPQSIVQVNMPGIAMPFKGFMPNHLEISSVGFRP